MKKMARILVVDDDEAVLQSFQVILSVAGHEVETARGGREAIKRIRKDTYDLVLVDLVMPDVGGLEVLREVREVSPDAAVVIITGHASLDSAVQAVRAGANDYLLKTATTPEIMIALERSLEKQRLNSELRRRNRELAAVNAVARAVSQTLDLDTMLQSALEQTRNTLDLFMGAIWLLDEQEPKMRLVAHLNLLPGLEEKMMEIELGKGIEGQVAQTLEPIIVKEWDTYPDAALRLPDQTASLVSVPLYAKGKLFGVMSFLAQGDREIIPEDVEVLKAVANQIALGIDNAQLFAQVRRKSEELEMMNRELVETRDQLVKQERLAAIGQIGLTVRHEINNPLTAIMGRADWLLETHPELPEEVRLDLEVIFQMSKRISHVVNRLRKVEDKTTTYIGDAKMIDLGELSN